MGKVPTATAITETKRRKKKGRPSKNPVSVSTSAKPPVSNSTSRRSTRRNPNHFNSPLELEFDDDDDDDERKEKKVKLVVRLPQSDEKSMIAENHQQQSSRHSNDSDSGSESPSGSESDLENEDLGGCAKKRKIIGVDHGSDDGDVGQDKEVVKTTETPLHGSPLESGPTNPLPDKKLLVFILDRLQKKDTYGVFSEPVDLDELPDYFDIIKQPMDFGTVRKKLENGAYKTLEELEADVNLICSNAMEYNASYTVYYRQARSIQELAKRDFSNLKHEGDDGEPQPKVVRRGRPPSNKNLKKSLETSPVIDCVSTELSSGATLANVEDKATGSNLYNLRKGSALLRSRSNEPFVSSYGSRNGENYLETDWNDEFPASILRADMKYGKKQFTVDENKRDTYRESSNNFPFLYNSVGNMKQLVPVGLQEALSYARSLARYAANLGPVAWKIASKKIDTALPAGVQYGPGWVGDSGPSQPLPTPIQMKTPYNRTTGDCSSSKLTAPSTSDLNSAVGKLNSQDELAGQGGASSRTTLFSPQQSHSLRNGSNGMIGYDLSGVHEQAPLPPTKVEMGPTNSAHGEGEKWAFVKSQQRHALSIPPDLNVRVPGGSPRPGLQIGSPRQPDLALQL